MANKAVIETKNVFKSFGSNQVLKGFDFTLMEKENVVVLGKSGSGKSVLIKCIIGLMKPDSGSIKVFNEEITNYNAAQFESLRTRVGFLFQSNALYDSMTVRQNLEFPLRRHAIYTNEKDMLELVKEALSNVGLEHTMDMMPSELSGGMRKRIALARTLILKPKIILYDEPTTGLDPVTGKEISHLMLEIQKKYETASLIISHDVNCVKIVANRIVVLIDGRCYAVGTYQELMKSEDKLIKQFFD